MKKIICLILVFFIIFTVYFSLSGAAKTVKLRLAETHPADYPTTKGDLEFARLIKERTNGRITVDVYPGAQLGEEKAALEQVQLGAIDFTRVSVSVTASFAPKLNALQLPYLYRDADHMWKVLNGPVGNELLASMDSANFIGIGWYDGGTRNFYTKKLVKSPADLKGLKIRVQQSALMVGLVESLGAVATPLPYGEVYSALQTGVIDGAENNFPSYLTQSHYENAKFYVKDAHTRVPEILVGSKVSLSKLAKRDIEIIKKAAKDSLPLQIKLWNAYEKESETKVKAAGCTVTELSAKEVQAFMDAMKPLYDKQPKDIMEVVNKVRAVK